MATPRNSTAHSEPSNGSEAYLLTPMRASCLRVRHEPFLGSFVTSYRGDARPRLLNPTGVVVTACLAAGRPLKDAVDHLALRYPKQPRETLEADVTAFARRVEERGGAGRETTAYVPHVDLAPRQLPAGLKNAFLIPDRVQIEVTKKCNLRCHHCYVPGTSGKNAELTTEELVGIIDRLSRWGVFTLELTGGEPLLRRDIREIIRRVATQSMAVVLYTNATLLRRVLDQDLVDWVTRFAISLDGPEEYHDQVRGRKGAFAETARAIRAVADLGGHVSISYTLTPESTAYAEDVKRLVHDLGAENFLCSPPTPLGRGRDLDYSVDDYRRMIKCALESSETARHSGSVKSPVLPREFTCAAGKDFFFISSDGQLYPCPFFSIQEFAYGHAVRDSLEDLWLEAPVLERFRAVEPCNDPRCVCESCPVWCRALHFHLTGQLEGDPTAYCPRLGA